MLENVPNFVSNCDRFYDDLFFLNQDALDFQELTDGVNSNSRLIAICDNRLTLICKTKFRSEIYRSECDLVELIMRMNRSFFCLRVLDSVRCQNEQEIEHSPKTRGPCRIIQFEMTSNVPLLLGFGKKDFLLKILFFQYIKI